MTTINQSKGKYDKKSVLFNRLQSYAFKFVTVHFFNPKFLTCIIVSYELKLF